MHAGTINQVSRTSQRACSELICLVSGLRLTNPRAPGWERTRPVSRSRSCKSQPKNSRAAEPRKICNFHLFWMYLFLLPNSTSYMHLV